MRIIYSVGENVLSNEEVDIAMMAAIKPYCELHNAMAYTLQEDADLLKIIHHLCHLSATFSAPNVEWKDPVSAMDILQNLGSHQYGGNRWVAPWTHNSWAGPLCPFYDQTAYPWTHNKLWFNSRPRSSGVIPRRVPVPNNCFSCGQLDHYAVSCWAKPRVHAVSIIPYEQGKVRAE